MNEQLLSELRAHVSQWFVDKGLLSSGQSVEIKLNLTVNVTCGGSESYNTHNMLNDESVLNRILLGISNHNCRMRISRMLSNMRISNIEMIKSRSHHEFYVQPDVGTKSHVLFAHALAKEGVECDYTRKYTTKSLNQLEAERLSEHNITDNEWSEILKADWRNDEKDTLLSLQKSPNQPLCKVVKNNIEMGGCGYAAKVNSINCSFCRNNLPFRLRILSPKGCARDERPVSVAYLSS
ncbi:MAG: hypothetical protein WC666_01315 [Candidatus Paceibacterota bacterium]